MRQRRQYRGSWTSSAGVSDMQHTEQVQGVASSDDGGWQQAKATECDRDKITASRQGERRCAPCCARGSATTSIRAGSAPWSSTSFDGRVVRATVPVKFLKSWIQSHYADDLLQCCAAEFTGVERVEVILRQPGFANGRPSEAVGQALARSKAAAPGAEPVATEARRVAVQPPDRAP